MSSDRLVNEIIKIPFIVGEMAESDIRDIIETKSLETKSIGKKSILSSEDLRRLKEEEYLKKLQDKFYVEAISKSKKVIEEEKRELSKIKKSLDEEKKTIDGIKSKLDSTPSPIEIENLIEVTVK